MIATVSQPLHLLMGEAGEHHAHINRDTPTAGTSVLDLLAEPASVPGAERECRDARRRRERLRGSDSPRFTQHVVSSDLGALRALAYSELKGRSNLNITQQSLALGASRARAVAGPDCGLRRVQVDEVFPDEPRLLRGKVGDAGAPFRCSMNWSSSPLAYRL